MIRAWSWQGSLQEMLKGSYMVSEIEPGLAACKAYLLYCLSSCIYSLINLFFQVYLLLNFQIFVGLQNVFVLLLSDLIPWWFKNIVCDHFNPFKCVEASFIAQHLVYLGKCSICALKECEFPWYRIYSSIAVILVRVSWQRCESLFPCPLFRSRTIEKGA